MYKEINCTFMTFLYIINANFTHENAYAKLECNQLHVSMRFHVINSARHLLPIADASIRGSGLLPSDLGEHNPKLIAAEVPSSIPKTLYLHHHPSSRCET